MHISTYPTGSRATPRPPQPSRCPPSATNARVDFQAWERVMTSLTWLACEDSSSRARQILLQHSRYKGSNASHDVASNSCQALSEEIPAVTQYNTSSDPVSSARRRLAPGAARHDNYLHPREYSTCRCQRDNHIDTLTTPSLLHSNWPS